MILGLALELDLELDLWKNVTTSTSLLNLINYQEYSLILNYSELKNVIFKNIETEMNSLFLALLIEQIFFIFKLLVIN